MHNSVPTVNAVGFAAAGEVLLRSGTVTNASTYAALPEEDDERDAAAIRPTRETAGTTEIFMAIAAGDGDRPTTDNDYYKGCLVLFLQNGQ
jgi:hypothetical protein